MNKKLRIALIVLAALVAAWIGLSMMTTKIPKVQTFAMEERDRLPIGRAGIGVFEAYKVIGSTSRYGGLTLQGDDAMSEPSFLAWVDRRWNEIQKADAEQDAEHRPKIYRPYPHEVGFKFNALDISDTSAPEWVYDGEGGVWLDNKAVFVAPGGATNADKKITNIIDHLREMKSKDDKGYCLEFYCLDLPVSDNEASGVVLGFPSIPGFHMAVLIETYTSEQNEYYSQRSPSINGLSAGNIAYYVLSSEAKIVEIDGLKGELDISGVSQGFPNGRYQNSVKTRWYHPGTSKDPNDPAITIDSIYSYETDHKPSSDGWFDDATVKKTGFTPEKFMSMWEATLKSFKRNR